MHGNVVEMASCLTKQRFGPIWVGSGSSEQFQIFSHTEHEFCRLTHQWSPFLHGSRTEFVRSPVFVAHTPVFHVVGLLMAVCHSHTPPFADAQVAVSHPIAHLFRRACSGISTDVRFAPHLTAPLYVFIRTESVGVFHLPRLVVDGLAILPHSVHPVVSGHEAPTWPTHDRDFDLLERINNICTETILVSKLRLRIVDTAINLIVEMLDEVAENHFVVLNLCSIRLHTHLVLRLHNHRAEHSCQ